MKFAGAEESIIVGKHLWMDEHVLLGYATGRKISNRQLIVGDHAHIRSGSVIYEGTMIGAHLTTGHNVVIREENVIGDHFTLWSNSVVDYGCKIGDRVKIHSNCYIAQFTTIQDDAFLAPGVTIANDLHPGCERSQECMRGPTIEKGAQIGVNVTLLPFVTIGQNALVGAGSVVTKDVPPETVVAGNPARIRSSIYELQCIKGLTEEPYSKERG
jgi:acetyltransferase-like isoleucine patch superfamily enzyme